MAAVDVVLEYKREVNQSTGRVVLKSDKGDHVCADFEKIEFAPMLTRFAEALQNNPEAAGIIQRTDRPGLVAYALDQRLVDLFRTDPVAAIASMSTPYGSPSSTIQRVKEERLPQEAGLRVGYDTLADAFGGSIYSKYHSLRDRAECPCCGIWGRVHTGHNGGGTHLHCLNTLCALYDKAFPTVIAPNDKWVTFKTSELLATGSERFYLPRAWNDGRPWVTWLDLNDKYIAYEKEKGTWLDQQ